MSNHNLNFFTKYISEQQEILWVIHKHFSVVFLKLFFWLSIAILPSFVYYYSSTIQEFLPFYILEVCLILIYIKIIYDIFDRYNDVWIIHSDWITDLSWSLFKKKTSRVEFDNIEWVWVEQNWIIDSILKKWDLVIHKIWDEKFILEDVFLPFKKTELIEDLSEEYAFIEAWEDNINDKFNTLINALHWVIENFWNKDSEKNKKKEELEEKLEKIKNNDWTIDLR